MKPDSFLTTIVDPGLSLLAKVGTVPLDDRARVLVHAIAGQESAWSARRQGGGGPARSYYQFEKGGGVAQVFKHATQQIMAVCNALDIPADQTTVFEAMAWNDDLATAMARLLLWTDPRALPAVGDQESAWRYYLHNWKPGKPHPETWPARYRTALALISA